jgi:hypothetical protein
MAPGSCLRASVATVLPAEPATGAARLTARRSTVARSAFVVFLASSGTVFRERHLDGSMLNSRFPEREYSSHAAGHWLSATDSVRTGRRAWTARFRIPLPNVELTGRRRQDAKPGPQRMYRVPADRAWWPAVGAPVQR